MWHLAFLKNTREKNLLLLKCNAKVAKVYFTIFSFLKKKRSVLLERDSYLEYISEIWNKNIEKDPELFKEWKYSDINKKIIIK